MELKLYQHQQRLVDLNPARHLLAWSTGTGKTLTTVELAEKNFGTSVLIICPKSLKTNWQRQVPHYWSVKTKEEFRRDWKKMSEFKVVVVDEAHFFGNYRSQMSKALLGYFEKWQTPFRYLATATPFQSSAWNLFSLSNLLGYKMDWYKFKMAYFYDVRMGNRMVPMQRAGIEDDMREIIARIGSTVKLEDCIDLPEQIEEVEYFELSKDQRIGISKVNEINFISRWTKIFQIMNGTLKGNEYEPEKRFTCNKFERIKELSKENPRMIVVCRHLSEIQVVKEMLGEKVWVIQGDTEDKQAILDQLSKTPEYVLLVSAGCAEGWELPECPLMVFFSLSFSLTANLQMKGRINRINHPKKNTYLYLIIKDEEYDIDEEVFRCIQRKSDFHLALYKNHD